MKGKQVPKKLADGRDYGRSMVISKFGIVATSQTLASQAGADILTHGGNAIDAAIAANAALSVTEPMMNGIGGDLFAIYYEAKTGKIYGLNASGWSAKSMTLDFLKSQGVRNVTLVFTNSSAMGFADGQFIEFDDFADEDDE